MTTIIITLVVLVRLGIVLVDGDCQTNGGPTLKTVVLATIITTTM